MEASKNTYKKEAVKFYFKNKANGRKSIYLEIYENGKRTYERIPDLFMLMEIDDASIKKNKATLNKAEKLRRKRMRELHGQSQEKSKYIQSDNSKQSLALADWMDQYYEIQKKRGVRNLTPIKRVKALLQQYKADVTLDDIDKDFCLGFVDFLRTGYTCANGNHLSPKSGFNTLLEFSTALTTAVRENIIPMNPMTLLSAGDKIQPIEQIREYLTIEEVKKLIVTPCESEIVKQAYLFACNCGLRLGDIKAMLWKDISFEDGMWRVAIRMLKTEKIIYIPLPQQAMQWLPTDERIPDNLVFPTLTENKIGQYLKPWAKEAGIINKDVCFHTSRHTYATMLLTLGVDLYTVSKLLGHTSIRHTQRYAKIINQKKDDAIALLDDAEI
ncbi:MAG: site-specific integrase [Bacilli bacterium]|jgi:integrase|nr:site-specific integrase [Bacilli bacterium]